MGCSQRLSSRQSRMSWSVEGALGLGLCLVLFRTGVAEGSGVEGDAGGAATSAMASGGGASEGSDSEGSDSEGSDSDSISSEGADGAGAAGVGAPSA